MPDETKQCQECRQIKPLIDFPVRRNRPDGHHWWCFDCKRARYREYQKAYRERDPERVRRSARRYARKPEVRSRNGAANLMVKYGLTAETFAAKLAAQDGKCPFCPPGAPATEQWDVDHDHTCCPGSQTCGDCLRDLLCHRHNLALGMFDDDPALLRAAAGYIERHRARIKAAGTTPWQPKGVRSGARHPWWTGDNASPDALRQRARKVLGAATRCINGCTSGRYEWVCAHGADLAEVASYIPLCRKCSVAHHGQIGAGNPTAKLTDEQAAEIRARYVRGKKPSQWDLAHEYGVSQGAISLIVRGEHYKTP